MTTRSIWRSAAARAVSRFGMAAQHPDVNFIAVEREEGALIMAAERCQQHPLPNLRFVSFDAAQLHEVFAPGEVDRIYLNFSDPWPPNRQRKRRLTWRAIWRYTKRSWTPMATCVQDR